MNEERTTNAGEQATGHKSETRGTRADVCASVFPVAAWRTSSNGSKMMVNPSLYMAAMVARLTTAVSGLKSSMSVIWSVLYSDWRRSYANFMARRSEIFVSTRSSSRNASVLFWDTWGWRSCRRRNSTQLRRNMRK